MGVEREARPVVVVPCARCGGAAETFVWEHNLCPACTAAWFHAPGFTAGEVGLELSHEAMCAEYRKRTAAWARAPKAVAA